MTKRDCTFYLTLLSLLFLPALMQAENKDKRPNIVWIFAEDMNDWMGCYGDKTVPTPNIDKLAARGVRFNRAYMPAGVCSATRSALALGAMQTSLGVHNHRSSRQRTPGDVIQLPEGVLSVYQTLRQGGYYSINYGPKNDFNFLWPCANEEELARLKGSVYGTGAYRASAKDTLLYDVNIRPWAPMGNHLQGLLSQRAKDKPFFLQLQLKGGKNSGRFAGSNKIKPTGQAHKFKVFTDVKSVKVMPYYPDIPSFRAEIAHHYDCIRQTDDEVGRIIADLKAQGVYDNTIIFFFTDHGMKLPRHKQWLYEGGIRVPLIVSGPRIPSGTVRDDLVSGIDISSTTLALAGVNKGAHMEGLDIFAADFKRDYVISARDRCDFTIDRVRAVTGKRYKLIRNYMTDRAFMQPQYRDMRGYMKDMKAHYQAGKMNEVQSFLMSERRVEYELYDLQEDPDEIRNLANSPEHKAILEKMQKKLYQWVSQSADKGANEESVKLLKGVLKQWEKEAVNPEYKKARQ